MSNSFERGSRNGLADMGAGKAINRKLQSRLISQSVSLVSAPFFFWFVSYTYVYVFTLVPLKPLYSYYAFIAFTAVVAVLYSIRPDYRLFLPHLRQLKFFYLWFIAYLVYFPILFLYGAQSDETVQVLITRIELGLIGLLSLYLYSLPDRSSLLPMACAIAVVLGVVLNLIDFVDPFYSKVSGRAAGFYVNPNISAKLLSMLMPLAILVLPRHLRLLFAIIVGAGVILTFSRGGWLTWALGVGLLMYFRVIPLPRSVIWRGALAILLTAPVVYLLFSGVGGDALQGSSLEKYMTNNTLGRLSGEFSDHSAIERRLLLELSVEKWLEAPVFGQGLGYTLGWAHPQQPHNMYVLMLVEGGLVGLLFLLGLPLLLWRTKDRIALIIAAQFCVASMFTHNNLDQPAMVLIVSLVVASAAKKNDDRCTAKIQR